MHILIGIVGLIIAAGVWAWRLRMAKQALEEVSNVAGDVIAAARRMGFKRQTNVHPVESIEEPELAVAALGVAFLDLASLPTAEQLATLKTAICNDLAVDHIKADEMLIISRWLVNECKTPQQAFSRLLKRLSKLDKNGFQPLLAVLTSMKDGSVTDLNPRQRDALGEVASIFRLT